MSGSAQAAGALTAVRHPCRPDGASARATDALSALCGKPQREPSCKPTEIRHPREHIFPCANQKFSAWVRSACTSICYLAQRLGRAMSRHCQHHLRLCHALAHQRLTPRRALGVASIAWTAPGSGLLGAVASAAADMVSAKSPRELRILEARRRHPSQQRGRAIAAHCQRRLSYCHAVARPCLARSVAAHARSRHMLMQQWTNALRSRAIEGLSWPAQVPGRRGRGQPGGSRRSALRTRHLPPFCIRGRTRNTIASLGPRARAGSAKSSGRAAALRTAAG